MTTFIVIVILAILIGMFIARNYISTLTGLSVDTITRTCVMILFCLIAITGFRSCAGGAPTTGAGSGVGNGLWILIGIGLVISAIVTRAHGQLPYIFSAGAGAILIVLLGKFDSLFTWAVIGLPFFAAAGIWGSIKTEGRTRSFLGFASGIIILFWMYMFYQTHPIENVDFITTFFPDVIAMCIFAVFLALFAFATWKKSFWYYTASLFVFISFLGGATDFENGNVFDEIFNRFPEKLTPSISSNGAVGKLSGAVGKWADAVASKADSSATREEILARQAKQVQKTWSLAIGTTVYDNPSEDIIQPKSDLKYTEITKVISLGESLETPGGAIYEKCGLPDPITGQPGAKVGWVFSGDLKEEGSLEIEKNGDISSPKKETDERNKVGLGVWAY